MGAMRLRSGSEQRQPDAQRDAVLPITPPQKALCGDSAMSLEDCPVHPLWPTSAEPQLGTGRPCAPCADGNLNPAATTSPRMLPASAAGSCTALVDAQRLSSATKPRQPTGCTAPPRRPPVLPLTSHAISTAHQQLQQHAYALTPAAASSWAFRRRAMLLRTVAAAAVLHGSDGRTGGTARMGQQLGHASADSTNARQHRQAGCTAAPRGRRGSLPAG